jgi:hypothetical protein
MAKEKLLKQLTGRIPSDILARFQIALIKNGHRQGEALTKLAEYYAKNGLPQKS